MPPAQHVPADPPRLAPVGVVGVVGAGPAGLTAAHELSRHGVSVQVFEATGVVGGISQTVERDGWRFDIGGHRFFTKVPEVEALWHEFLSEEEFLLRPRMSRILYRGRLFDYPLKVGNALGNLGVLEAVGRDGAGLRRDGALRSAAPGRASLRRRRRSPRRQ